MADISDLLVAGGINAAIAQAVEENQGSGGGSKASIGLSNVDNTSDANKPVSAPQAAALALKQDVLVSGTHIKTMAGVSLLGPGDLPGDTTYQRVINNATITSQYEQQLATAH